MVIGHMKFKVGNFIFSGFFLLKSSSKLSDNFGEKKSGGLLLLPDTDAVF